MISHRGKLPIRRAAVQQADALGGMWKLAFARLTSAKAPSLTGAARCSRYSASGTSACWGTIEAATFTQFSVVPWIVAGSGLNSGAAKWEHFWPDERLHRSRLQSRAPLMIPRRIRSPLLDAETWEVTQLARARS